GRHVPRGSRRCAMLKRLRPTRQPTLLDHYWAALRHDRSLPPPDGLDPEAADVVASLQRSLTPPDPPTAFVERLERRLDRQIASRPAAPTLPPRTWSAPARDGAERWTAAASKGEKALPVPLPRSKPFDRSPSDARRSWTHELADLVAAACVFVLVGAVLVL